MVDEALHLSYQVAMICNDSLLFVHVPKTGGMSISHSLLKCLPKPVYNFVPEGDAERVPAGVEVKPGKRHEFLSESLELSKDLGITPTIIMACIRSPYELEVSRFFYLRKGHAWDKGPAQDLAMTNDFEKFAIDSPYHGRSTPFIHKYFEVDGKFPDTLRILKHESLDEDYAAVMADLGIKVGRLPKRNATEHDHFDQYMTPAVEEAIYQKFQWVFDKGLYQRYIFED